MKKAEQYSFLFPDKAPDKAHAQPYLPIRLICNAKSLNALGLLDTGATVNVLPYELGLLWEEQKTAVKLTGNLGQVEARAVLLSVIVG